MVLKYLTKCEHNHTEQSEAVFYDQWNYLDGIKEASIYYDKAHQSTVASLTFEDKTSATIALHYEAYLLNENGKTIEKIRL